MLEMSASLGPDKTVPCTLANPDTVSNEAYVASRMVSTPAPKRPPQKGHANQEDHKQRTIQVNTEAEISRPVGCRSCHLDNFHMPNVEMNSFLIS